MTDHTEEQEMEAEALAAIFETHFKVVDGGDAASAKNPDVTREWTIDLYPEHASDDDEELQSLNHVSIQLHIRLPPHYPGEDDADLPKLQVRILKGLAQDPHGVELQALAEEEASANRGLPSIYAVAEKLREWLVEHNRPGLDDTSAYASMLRKQEKEKKKAAAAAAEFESQTAQEELTAAEKEELEIRKRRAEGMPCTKENFEAWKTRFEAEMATVGANQSTGGGGGADETAADKKPAAVAAMATTTASAATASRLTGYDYFSSRSTNLEALEAAAEQAAAEYNDEDDDDEAAAAAEGTAPPNHVNEDLFDDDVDLDDLDFDDEDDDDEEDDDDDDDDVDI
ncbi:hypothetical protein ACA910_002263 [Epithemia clementina (nom. ined.)]